MAEQDKLLKELLELSDMLQTAETAAGKALEHMATLRKYHRAKLVEWRKASKAVEPVVHVGVDKPDIPVLLDAVSDAIKRSEGAEEVRVELPSTGGVLDGTMGAGEDGATRSPSDTSHD